MPGLHDTPVCNISYTPHHLSAVKPKAPSVSLHLPQTPSIDVVLNLALTATTVIQKKKKRSLDLISRFSLPEGVSKRLTFSFPFLLHNKHFVR